MTAEQRPPAADDADGAAPSARQGAVVLSDPKAIRALAHGVRLQVIEALFDSDDSFTATELATRFGLTPSAMSYHLRSLERWGLVIRAGGNGDGRERHWKSAGSHLTIDTSVVNGGSGSFGMFDTQISQLRDRVSKYLATPRPAVPEGSSLEDLRRLPTVTQGAVLLTPAEREELADELWALLRRFRRPSQAALAAQEAGEATEFYRFFFSFIPEVDAERSPYGESAAGEPSASGQAAEAVEDAAQTGAGREDTGRFRGAAGSGGAPGELPAE
ncbi:helix-turn-helix domain-containing protein [Falsarthrobacter nasiphocae]|uniref:DNA-binding transcriptional ArsR family regulator n=1 Tax=Falsarthrobacter nasiphocae TaxID=189863 RepID=A0AAE3YHG2_9MICC|nr:helix-turn-helix domain-containing protein [Falsarthrobacter nasiphocae]MDR6892362.1 DNA-binding transcriptional ArsR family regulator [Falsarthrobacter nasiphocae]